MTTQNHKQTESELTKAIKMHEAFRRQLMKAYDAAQTHELSSVRYSILDINTDAIGIEKSIEDLARIVRVG